MKSRWVREQDGSYGMIAVLDAGVTAYAAVKQLDPAGWDWQVRAGAAEDLQSRGIAATRRRAQAKASRAIKCMARLTWRRSRAG